MLRTIISVVISAVLLVMAFPQVNWSVLAWMGLVPWLLMLDKQSPRAAFGWSFLAGFLFFFGTLGWFIYVTYVGALVLIAYLSLYFALFGLAYRFFKHLPTLSRILVLSSVWVALEFLRAHCISGFSWASLAHSQYQNIYLIQMADITGFYGVSFLIIAVNILITLTIQQVKDYKKNSITKSQVVVFILILIAFAYGLWRVQSFPQPSKEVAIGVVQPNIHQDMKWDERLQPWIVQKTINLTAPLAHYNLDLIVWPETSLPGVVNQVPELFEVIKANAKQITTPILMGAITDQEQQYFNSAYMIDANGKVQSRYDKIHLVLFGEYIPLRPYLNWLANLVGLEDFTSGKKYTQMKTGRDETPFGVLICFEDTVGYVWRNFTNQGAQFFVNMTNDAWFKDTKAPYIHLSAAILEAVANKRALVRSANTGVSGFIDPFGRIISLAQDGAHKKTFINAYANARVPAVTHKTFYTKYADVFAYMCFLGILVGVIQRRKLCRLKKS